MNDLETRLRETMKARAGEPGLRRMPPGTINRVRRREVGFVATVGAVVVASVVVGAGILWLLPRGEGSLPGDGSFTPSHPLEAVPDGWPQVRIGDPGDAYVNPGDALGLIGAVHVLASGTVNGYDFTFTGWTGGGDEAGGAGPCIGFAGPGAGTPPTEPALQGFGGVSSGTCAHAHEAPVPSGTDLYLAAQQAGSLAPGIVAHYGFLSSRVAELQVRLEGQSPDAITILEGPAGWGNVQAFVFFPPDGFEGSLTALDVDGRALATAELCVYDGVSGGCAGPTEQLVPPEGSTSS